MATVQVILTSSGYLPTIYWGKGSSADREAYGMAYDSLETAERMARDWALQQGAEYVPYAPIDQDAIRRQALLVKQLRDDEGLDLRAATAKARAIIASMP
mgnify:CR=1 FL=1